MAAPTSKCRKLKKRLANGEPSIHGANAVGNRLPLLACDHRIGIDANEVESGQASFQSVGKKQPSFGFHEVKRLCRDELARCLAGEDTGHVHPQIQFADIRAFGEVELLEIHPENVG